MTYKTYVKGIQTQMIEWIKSIESQVNVQTVDSHSETIEIIKQLNENMKGDQ